MTRLPLLSRLRRREVHREQLAYQVDAGGDESRMSNIAQRIWEHAERDPDGPAVKLDDEVWTFEEFRRRCVGVADSLEDLGVARGDRVVLVQSTRPSFLSAYYGLAVLGAVVVPVNTMATPSEIHHVVTDAGARLILAGRDCSLSAEGAAESAGVLLTIIDDLAEGPRDETAMRVPVDVGTDDVAMFLYTSGTTGRPKGAVLTHGNIEATHQCVADVVSLTAEDVVASALPLFHVYGGTIIAGMTISRGATVSLIHRFSPEKVLEVLTRDHVTIYAGVPTMHNALVNYEGVAGREQFVDLRVCMSGGASLPVEVLKAFDDRFGAVLLEGYGMTEMTGCVSFTRPEDERMPGTVGVPLGGVEVRVVDDQGADCAPGTVGELICRGPQLMREYHNLPEATAEVLRDGWYLTGDLASLADDGVISIVGRRKELIIRGGYNVYPREVEEVLIEHPDVLDIAVVGIADKHYGQEVAAMIATRPGAQIDTVTFRAWAKERLSAYKVPRFYSFVDELPKGPTGKVLKRSIGPVDFRDAPRGDRETSS